ncbi:Acyl-CoA synthetase family member 3, mitochondrial [Cyphellophora attinorum]|uniref:Acyl-CoA synthetase family member 3, mitochondrial n=1 Tax=Cyphellophora attinorum TaxID=1664694 RepID=A0A0N1HX57_9EURO|nr:Acyl-CoA synthetase family member 3, mitochondrial [Phialophora attinorum]KPI42445.1 Acyl-CoA synthetase family member 3, mitochondrial [Phialophora attinorum]
MDPADRDTFAPRHIGRNVFPNFLYWGRLVRLAHKQHLLAVRDLTFGYTATYQQLLTDVLHYRNTIHLQLDHETQDRLARDEEVFVNVLGPGGYEFTVAFLALMALGAVIVPISPDLPVKEAEYFATKCTSVAVLTAQKCMKLGGELENVMRRKGDSRFQRIEIAPHIMQTPLPLDRILVSSDKYFDMNKSGQIIFTSGTTGPPKGAVKRRGFFIDVATMFCDQYDMREGDLVLHVLPVHHATGTTLTLLPFLWAGGTIEFRSGGFNTEWTWDRISKGDLDFFSGVPTIYMRLMAHYEQVLRKLPDSHRIKYDQGAQRIRSMLCGTSALPRPLQNKWTSLRNGKPILTRYGLTEAGNAFNVAPWQAMQVPDGSVGTKMAGVDAKLSAYPEGEILIKSPIMFSKYLYDREATANSLDEEGYFKTGDIARKEGDFYFILGRASVDIIKSGGYKISALDIEREILGLDYVAEVMVAGVEDEEFGQRVAAAIVLKPDDKANGLTLDRLRQDLRTSLAGYKMPTLLRMIDGELRKNATGKVIKKALIPEYFPGQDAQGVQKWTGRKSKL